MYGISTKGAANLRTISLANGTMIKIPMDQYWAYYIDNIDSYEPEIKQIIDSFADKNTLFIDGGANVGLWSVYASGIIDNANQIVAVEPTETTLSILKENRALNHNNFTIIPKGIWNKSDEILEFKLYHSYAANSFKDNSEADGSEREIKGILKIDTISVDDIINDAKKQRQNINNIIIKLDVEGVEIEALDGMKKALVEDNILIIYEDHAKEETSETTNHILNKIGMNVYYINEEKTNEAIKIKELGQLGAIKTTKGKGYNFVACRKKTDFDNKMLNMCS